MNKRLVSNGYIININEELYYFVFSLWYSGELLFNTSANKIFGIDCQIVNNIISWMVFILLMVQIIFLQHYDLKATIVIVLITVIISISVILSGNRFIISSWMFIVAAKNVNFEKTIRIARKILLIGIPLTMILCYLGTIEDKIINRAGMIRHSLGFSHPNQLGLRLFQLVLCIIYIDRKSIRLKDFVIILVSALFCYKVPNSQTATISLVLLFVLMIGYKAINSKHVFRSRIYSSILVIGALLTNIASVVLSIIDVTKDKTLKMVDRVLSTRFSLGHIVYKLYGVSVFGQHIYVTEDERRLVGIGYKLWLDNSYLYMILRYGVLTYLIFSFLYLFGMKYFKDNEENIMVIILFLYSVYGIMETGLFMIQHNVFLISLGIVLYDRIGKYDKKYRISLGINKSRKYASDNF